MEGGFGGLKSIVWGSDKGTSGHHRVLSPRGRDPGSPGRDFFCGGGEGSHPFKHPEWVGVASFRSQPSPDAPRH